MASVGGRRPGAGRPKGARNKATGEVKALLTDLCMPHAPQAVQTLVDIACRGESEAARVAASQAILDRAYGKPVQATEITGRDGGAIQVEDVSALSPVEREQRLLAIQRELARRDGG